MNSFIKNTYAYIDKHKSWWLALALLGIILIEVACTVALPVWKEYFFNGVEQKVYHVFIYGLWYFVGLSSIFALSQSLKGLVQKTLSLKLRTGVIKNLKNKWYQNLGNKVDNPDQRIAEDSFHMTDTFLMISSECLISLLIVIGLLISMLHGNIYVLISSIVYTIVSCLVAHLFYRPMVNRDKHLQRREATFRYGLAKIRMKKEYSKVTFKDVITSYTSYIRILFGYSLFKRFQGNLTTAIPYLILIPLFFSGSIEFGEVMGGAAAFELMVLNTTIILQYYPDLTKTLAAWERVLEFWRQ